MLKHNILLGGSILVENQFHVKKLPTVEAAALTANKEPTTITSKVINAGQILAKNNQVYMLGYVGDDQNGEYSRQWLKDHNFKTDYIKTTSSDATGQVIIITDSLGQSLTTLYTGTNQSNLEIPDLKQFSAFFLATNLPLSTIYSILKNKNSQQPVLLDIPIQKKEIDQSFLQAVDFLIPNRVEAEALVNQPITNIDQAFVAAQTLQALNQKTVVVTLDQDGCVVVNNQIKKYLPAPQTKVIDTMAAGDIFRGTFFRNYLLTKNVLSSLAEAIKLATYSAGIRGVANSIQGSLKRLNEF